MVASSKPQSQMHEDFVEYVTNNKLIGADIANMPLPATLLHVESDINFAETCDQNKNKCAYKASNSLIYEIENKNIISIEMLQNKNGDWPMPLPFGIKSSDSLEQIVKTLSELHLIPLSGHLNEAQKKHPFVMYETRAPQYLEVWFGFNDNNQVERIMIISQQPD